ELGDLALLDGTRWRPEASIEKLEQRGWEALIDGKTAPLMVRRVQRERHVYALLFPLDHSTLPYRVGFPILLANLTRLGRQAAGLLDQEALRTGVVAITSLAPGQRYRVTGPDGYDREDLSDAEGRLAVPAPRVGVYSIASDDRRRTASVSLL